MVKPFARKRRPPVTAAGGPTSALRSVLATGARLLQSSDPLRGFDVYVVGFHCAKGEPGSQMEAHHYCKVVNDDLLQCVLFDGNTGDANLVGVEYIVSAHLFGTLPERERPYWHPHNFEVLSGQLIAPGLPRIAEKELMRLLMNSYGKTWHTWHTGRHDGEPAAALPVDEPKLMWSFNREGECSPELSRHRDRAMRLDTASRAAHRRSLLPMAHPQRGVDEMAGQFTGTRPVPGVVDERTAEPGRRATENPG
ncbi:MULTISPECIES: OBAP family protein [Actinopolyspora]|uniref:DUF1264 domain-containing protein n=1 Tax=Actinopolyspora saharensis TaxID=995062 RepID=A0A1H1FU56_9ACTN|nr:MULTISPECIES: OBAP family protein [Actinopolyspora]NHD19492.1 OBAP family protein [Actinopolyspora sp. BKK2]NHE77432.1 OBAP family protein [Actinopolyspora sp. BKK1]SDR04239.1 Protein of unknown function [Actinopolyspora saharensis]